MGRAARPRRCVVSHAARLPLRPLRVLSREAVGGGVRVGRSRRRAGGDRAAAADREARAPGDVHARQPDRRASLRRAVRDRPDLLDERHDRVAELHPADGGRPRELGDWLGAQLRGVGRHGRPARGVVLQRRAVRGGRGDRGVRPDRPLPHPGRHREHRAPAEGGGAAPARGGDPDAFLRRLSDRVGGGAEHRSRRVERRARARGGRARRGRAGLPREARGGLGRAGDRGDGDRRHRRVALGRVRAAGRHAPRRARLRPRRADRSGDGRRGRARRRRHGRARADASPASRGTAAALPHARPRQRPD